MVPATGRGGGGPGAALGRAGWRVGAVDAGEGLSIGSNVKAISLDQLINNKIQAKTGFQGLSSEESGKEIKALLAEMDSLKHQREDKLKELTNFQDALQKRTLLEAEAQRLRMRRQELGNKLTALRDKIKSDNRSLDSLRRQMRREVLLEADVVCSTLSGAGHEVLVDQEFEMVIIDEAAQSIELSSLIPLKFNSTRCVLVGDPQQLPPTVISQEVRCLWRKARIHCLHVLRQLDVGTINPCSSASSTRTRRRSIS